MIQKHWEEEKNYKHKPHVPLALLGRFKQTNGALKTFIQPLAVTTTLGIRIQVWIGRTVEEYHKLGIVTGPMFQTVGRNNEPQRATVSHLDELMHDILKQVQLRQPEIIASDTKIEDVYSVCCSLRCNNGSTKPEDPGVGNRKQ
ncbi:hypothetical protein ACA910_002251 [Epithemia clementina (nom. ined.)]